MDKREILDRMTADGVVPLIRTASASEAFDVAAAIKDGGASFLEITMTVPGAIDVIKELSLKYKDEFIIGAGTVLDPETARACILAGAQFIVSPVLNFDLISLTHRYSVAVVPGAMTPTEILTAWSAGADLVKVFPVGQLQGPDYIKAVKEPLPQVLIMASGGVTLENAGILIRAGAAVVAAGGNLVDKKAVKEKAFHIITERTRAFLRATREARAS
ncbi:MAG: bifunctional 4-hydroxy-2-oxoglutarate aldolase/2-dehydro-3-deoxy-phosphogluconate aldolase [Desulfomonile tiedjei]|nr:bifunctional 4-hydroxy-2-oxoglutarate aldolase/2-dehydro-3-deoxy-phosphogluconate aldolase [Desulfomonile tiedjei]